MALISDIGTLTSRIARELHRETDAGFSLEIREAIEQAIDHYSTERFSWLQKVSSGLTTVADQSNYTLPSDLVRLDEVTLTDGTRPYPVEAVAFDWNLYFNSAPTVTQQPYRYSLYDDSLWWYPTPDDAYTFTLYYGSRLTALTEPDDSNEWITKAGRLLINHVVADLGPLVDMPPAKVSVAMGKREDALSALRRDSLGRTSIGQITPRRL